jgi:sodium/potassium/calcium exchanger 6
MGKTPCLWDKDIDEAPGPLNIDYHSLSCSFERGDSTYIIFFVLLLAWILWLIHILGQTSSNYFSPTLGEICKQLNMDSTLAGVTLLAFGNGAPDVFSVLASFRRSPSDPSVGIGSIVGGSIFISTVIVGTLALYVPFEVPKFHFIRDCSSHLLSICYIALLVYLQTITIHMSLFILLLYAIYIMVVVMSLGNPKIHDEEIEIQEHHIHSLMSKSESFHSYQNDNGGGGSYRDPENSLYATANKNFNSCCSQMDWSKFSFQKRFHHRVLEEEWQDYSSVYKMYIWLFESPITFLRDISIPSLDPVEWNKHYAVMHPYADIFLMILLYNKFEDDIFDINPFLFNFLLGSVFAVPIFLLTTDVHPTSFGFNLIWMFMAFTMANIWVYLLAEEIVTALTALGQIIHTNMIHSDKIGGILGITVLAWGNSAPDFFNNLSRAKEGDGAMSIAACYAGPIFNVLIGFGFSLLFTTWNCYPKAYAFDMNNSLEMSMIILIFILVSTMVILDYTNYQLTRGLGIYLLVVYLAFIVYQVATM